MIWRFILWLVRWYEDIKESAQPHVKVRGDWRYNRKGDSL